MKNIFSVLKERGLIDAVTSDEIYELGKTPISVYIGFDPTSDSLHLGNMVGIMVLAWFKKLGHNPVAIVGGATGMIGDPSGKSVERVLLDASSIEKNLIGIKKSLTAILGDAPVLNNFDWFQKFGFIDFLRDVGKYFRVGTMLSKDSVKTRLNSAEGMSYTEFSYQILQGYDFLYLFDHHKVVLQMGGSDQWGNITAGTELVRKIRNQSVHGATFPLLTRSDGKKFGKTEEGAIWLNSEKLSPYDFYQYIYKIPDQDIIKLMKMITFMEMDEIKSYEEEMKKPSYAPNTAQKRLAEEVTRIVHKEEGLKSAKDITNQAQPGAKTSLDEKTLDTLAHELPTTEVGLTDVLNNKLIDLLVSTNIIPSKSEARRLIANGGLYLNNEKISDENFTVKESDLIAKKYLLLSVGKKKKTVIKIKK